MSASVDAAIEHLRAGRWQQAHAIVQDDESPHGCWAHGIVHMLEGDFSNARYWYGRAGRPYPGDDRAAQEIDVLVRVIQRLL